MSKQKWWVSEQRHDGMLDLREREVHTVVVPTIMVDVKRRSSGVKAGATR
jgi:hypothetical protein